VKVLALDAPNDGRRFFYALVFQPTTEPWKIYVRRALKIILKNPGV
jgi:hypothetical protein